MQYAELQVRDDSSTASELILQFYLRNRGTSGDDNITLSNYRITLLQVADSRTDEINVTTESGFAVEGMSAGVGVNFFPSTPVGYESPTHPPYLGSDDSAYDATFTYHLRSRFQGTNALTTLSPGQGIGDVRMRIRRNDIKIYSRANNNDPSAQRIYTLGYSYKTLSSTYAYSQYVGLEYNDVDPADEDSVNWQLVQQYDVSKIAHPPVLYPYNVSSLSDRLPTATDHAYLLVNEDGYIDRQQPSTTFSSGTNAQLADLLFDGSANTVRRIVQRYDFSTLPSGAVVKDAVILNHTTATGPDGSGGRVLKVAYAPAVVDESTATWDLLGDRSSYDEIASWDNFSNQEDIRDRSWTVRLNASSTDFDRIKDHGCIIYFDLEDDSFARFYIHTREAMFATIPGLLVRHSGSTPPVPASAKRFIVW